MLVVKCQSVVTNTNTVAMSSIELNLEWKCYEFCVSSVAKHEFYGWITCNLIVMSNFGVCLCMWLLFFLYFTSTFYSTDSCNAACKISYSWSWTLWNGNIPLDWKASKTNGTTNEITCILISLTYFQPEPVIKMLLVCHHNHCCQTNCCHAFDIVNFHFIFNCKRNDENGFILTLFFGLYSFTQKDDSPA